MHLLRMRRHNRHKNRKWRRAPEMTTPVRRNRKTGALNSNMTSDFKSEVVIWSKLRSEHKIKNKPKAASDS